MRTKLLLTSIAALFLATGTAHAKGTFTNAYEACLSEGGSETCDFVVGVLSGACANGYRSECRQLKQLNRLMRNGASAPGKNRAARNILGRAKNTIIPTIADEWKPLGRQSGATPLTAFAIDAEENREE